MPDLALRASSLAFHYPDGAPALNGCSLEVHAGEHLGIIGPNGAGKTTLLLLADGLLAPSAGEIEVLGISLKSEKDRQQARRQVGFLFQNSDDQLFSFTALEEAMFGPLNHGIPYEESRRMALLALAENGLQGYEQRVPQHLSGGEKRKLALASALSMQPEMLLFDEPTNNLDPKGRHEMMRLLSETGGTHIIATHDYEFVLHHCDRAALMEKGRVAACGTPFEILGDRDLLESHGLAQPEWLRHWLPILQAERSAQHPVA